MNGQMDSDAADLHGSAPDKADTALLLIDVINDLDFPEGKQLLHFALPMAERIAAVKRHARAQRIPTVYVNDNFGNGALISMLKSSTACNQSVWVENWWAC